MNRGKKAIWIAIFAINWAIILGYWWQGNSEPFSLIALGRLAGLAATYLILVQFLLMSRTPLLERVWGLDKLSRIHRRHGKIAIIVLLFHPILLALGYAPTFDLTFWQQLWGMMIGTTVTILATLSLALILVAVIFALRYVSRRVKYENWYFVHLLVYLAALGAVWHQFELGGTLNGNKIFYTYWLVLYLLVAVNHFWFRLARPWWLYRRHQFKVDRLKRETSTSTSIYLTGNNLKRFRARPGQFIIVRFLTPGRWWQAHPFSLSAIPTDQHLRLTVRELGDFTNKIKELAPGTKVIVDGPYGVFTNYPGSREKLLLIAGGIGITPIRSILEEATVAGKSAILIYGNKSADDIPFKKELDELTHKFPHLTIHHIIDERVDKQKISALAADLAERETYLCGPPPMMTSLIPALLDLGVPKHRLHYERFSF